MIQAEEVKVEKPKEEPVPEKPKEVEKPKKLEKKKSEEKVEVKPVPEQKPKEVKVPEAPVEETAPIVPAVVEQEKPKGIYFMNVLYSFFLLHIILLHSFHKISLKWNHAFTDNHL